MPVRALSGWAGLIALAWLVPTVPAAPAPAQPAPSLPEVLARAGRYVASFTDPPRRIVCRETAEQWFVLAIKASESAYDDGLAYRVMTSALTVAPAGALGVPWYHAEGSGPAAWEEARDVMTVGLLEPGGPTKAAAVRRRFGNPPDHPVNSPQPLPRFAIVFLHPANQPLYQFSKGGASRLHGVTAWKVDFKEAAPLVPGTSMRGSFWIDPATGRVLKTEVIRTTPPLVAEITATFEVDRDTGLYLPSRIKERSFVTEELRVNTSGRITNCRAMPTGS